MVLVPSPLSGEIDMKAELSGAPSVRRARPESRGRLPKETILACAVTRPAARLHDGGGGGGGGGGCISFQPSQPFCGPRPLS